MFNKKKQAPIKSLIAEGCHISGDIRFKDGLRIDGEVTGDIRGSDEKTTLLVISES
jgi:cytoskeletal protein CcmA (bactofilin family)